MYEKKTKLFKYLVEFRKYLGIMEKVERLPYFFTNYNKLLLIDLLIIK